MRLSTVFELLLIFLLIAFAAYGRVIDRDEFTSHRAIRAVNKSKQSNMGVNVMSLKQATENVNKYCTCVTHICNCCRDFNIPIVGLKGPGCASLQYLDRNRLGVQLSIGDNILTSTIVNGDKPKAVCFPMPGALTHFCGRVYSIQREADDHFKACLGLELQSSSELEASLRVSCFRFGPDGVALRPAEPLPIVEEEEKPADDDDDDLFGFDDDDDDEDDEDDDSALGNSVPGSSADTGDSTYDDDDDEDDDILGLGPLIDLFTGDDESDKKKKPQVTTQAPLLPFTIPIITKPTTLIVPNDLGNSNIGNAKPITEKPEVIEESAPIDVNTENLSSASENAAPDLPAEESPTTESTGEAFTNRQEATEVTEAPATAESVNAAANPSDKEKLQIVASNSDVVENVVKPDKKITIVKKVTTIAKKPSLTSNSPNAIKNDSKKPAVSSVIITKPTKPGTVQNYYASSQNTINNNVKDHEEEDDEDDDDILGTSDLDDEEDEDDDEEDDDDEKTENENTDNVDDENDDNEDINETEDDKNEEQHEEEAVEELIDDDDDDDDDDDETEEAVLTALVDDSDKIQNKVAGTVPSTTHEDDDSDYDIGISDLLVRRRRMRSGRQSKVMRL